MVPAWNIFICRHCFSYFKWKGNFQCFLDTFLALIRNWEVSPKKISKSSQVYANKCIKINNLLFCLSLQYFLLVCRTRWIVTKSNNSRLSKLKYYYQGPWPTGLVELQLEQYPIKMFPEKTQLLKRPVKCSNPQTSLVGYQCNKMCQSYDQPTVNLKMAHCFYDAFFNVVSCAQENRSNHIAERIGHSGRKSNPCWITFFSNHAETKMARKPTTKVLCYTAKIICRLFPCNLQN